VVLLSLAIAGAGVSSASAAIVCNADNVCWHVHRHYRYHHEWNLMVRPDDWRWGPQDHYSWREHHGRGYWDHDRWVAF
jgi:hypothetical protein